MIARLEMKHRPTHEPCHFSSNFIFVVVAFSGSLRMDIHIKSSIKLVLLDFSLTVKAAILILISGRGSSISSAKQGKSGSIYNLVKS